MSFLFRLLALTGLFLSFANASDPPASTVSSIVVLGDSIAAGYGIDPAVAFPVRLQERIEQAGLRFKIINAGVSGDTTAGGLRRLDWILRRPASVLVIELGGNDGLRGLPVEGVRSNLVAMIQKVRSRFPSIPILICGMQMPPSMGTSYTEAFRKVFAEVSEAEHTFLVPFLLEGVGGIAGLNQADQIHPNPEGHRKVAENVWKVLEPILKRLSSDTAKP
jgi:acyl-CoA thioesterase-1